MLFFRYLFDISSLRMNPCSPRFVYLFVVLQIIVRRASNACSSFLKPYLQVSCKPCTEVAILCGVVGSEGQARPAFA